MRFRDALAAPGFGAIAEFKRRSPSAGDLRPSGDVAAVARAYEQAGARAMSVLVDERFAGAWNDLRAAREATSLPLLAKGFFAADDDLRTAAIAGADAVLLLLRDLDDDACAALQREAESLGLDTLVEAHDAEELERATALGAPVIGINARDLSTFEIDRRAQLDLVAQAAGSTAALQGRPGFARASALQVPRNRIVVAESGIETCAQGAAAELAGAQAMLVGSTLMRAPDPGAKLADLIRRPLVKVCGLTRQEDVDVAVEAGVDLVGFILAKESPRRTDELLDAPETVLRVAVFVGETRETDADVIQFYERENGHRARDGIMLRNGEQVATVVDLPWEQVDPVHLDRARATEGRVMLAGGLDPQNVREAIDAVHPWAVDSARSTEREPGIKDHDAVRAWIGAAR